MRGRFAVAFLISLLALIASCEKSPARQELADKNVKYSEREFLKRVKDADLAAVELFLASKMNVDARDQEGQTALMIAASEGHNEIVRLLVEHGADVNTKDR